MIHPLESKLPQVPTVYLVLSGCSVFTRSHCHPLCQDNSNSFMTPPCAPHWPLSCLVSTQQPLWAVRCKPREKPIFHVAHRPHVVGPMCPSSLHWPHTPSVSSPHPAGLLLWFVYLPAPSSSQATRRALSMPWNAHPALSATGSQLNHHFLREPSLTLPVGSGLPTHIPRAIFRTVGMAVIYSHLCDSCPVCLPHSGGRESCLYLLTFVCLAPGRLFSLQSRSFKQLICQHTPEGTICPHDLPRDAQSLGLIPSRNSRIPSLEVFLRV